MGSLIMWEVRTSAVDVTKLVLADRTGVRNAGSSVRRIDVSFPSQMVIEWFIATIQYL